VSDDIISLADRRAIPRLIDEHSGPVRFNAASIERPACERQRIATQPLLTAGAHRMLADAATEFAAVLGVQGFALSPAGDGQLRVEFVFDAAGLNAMAEGVAGMLTSKESAVLDALPWDGWLKVPAIERATGLTGIERELKSLWDRALAMKVPGVDGPEWRRA
jgi:hypothetical protein